MASQTSKPSSVDADTKALPTEKILQPEFTALAHCLKDAVIKTGQIYSFHAEARKLGIENHVRKPPRSLTAALGRDVEKYDQICDSIEAHLLRAISVLKRDLRREEERIEAEERRKNTEALMLPPPVPLPISEALVNTSIQPSTGGNNTNPRDSSVLNAMPGRRPSAISISSLHRPQFPHKLDLSDASLRFTEEGALFSKGPASPVTLAPKSARAVGPNESFPELMAAFVSSSAPLDVPPDMDLTLPDGMHIPQKESDLTALGVGLGDSLDKPIELDLDAMDIEMANMTDHFGNPIEANDTGNAGDGLFSPILDNGEGEVTNDQPQKEEGNALANFEIDANVNDELFGDFTSGGQLGLASGASIPRPHSTSIPSPGSLLAQFSSVPDPMEVRNSSSTNPVVSDSGATFDLNSIDLSNLSNLAPGFFSEGQGDEMTFSMDMETFLNMDPGVDPKGEGDSSKGQNPA